MRNIYVLLLACISVSLYGQSDSLQQVACSYKLSGIVLDGETKEPLPGASIVVTETNAGAFTNEKGEFSLAGLCKGSYTLQINFVGFKSYAGKIFIQTDMVKTYILHADTCLLESVEIIVGTLQEEIQHAVEIKGKELDMTRGLSLGETLKEAPGVTVLQTGPSIFKPVIHGMYGNRVLILNNEVRMEGQQWGAEHGPEVDPFTASGITVVKGASGVRYGQDAIGGVILVNPEKLRYEPGLGGEVHLDGFSNNRQGVVSGRLDYHWKKIRGLSLRVQGTLKKAGNSRTPDYYMKNTAFREYDFSWAAGYRGERYNHQLFYSQFNSDIGIFSASHIGNITDIKRAITSPVPLETAGFTYAIDRPFQRVEHELFKFKSEYIFEKIGTVQLILARQFNYRAEYDKHKSFGGPAGEQAASEFKITSHTADLSLDHNAIGNLKGTAGLSFIRQGNTTGGTTATFIPNFISYAGGTYLIESWKNKKLELEAGLRYDYKWLKVYRFENSMLVAPEFTFSNFSGVAGAIYTVNSFWKIRSDAGTAFRPVTVNELFSNGLHHSAARLEYGNRDLKSEYSFQYSLTGSYRYRKLYGEIHGYANYIRDYIYLAPSLVYDASEQRMVPEYRVTIRGAFPVFSYQQINALFTGADATLNDSLSRHFIFSAKLSLLRAYNTMAREHIVLAPPSSLEYGIKYQRKISGHLPEAYLKLSQLLVARKSKVPEFQDVSPPPPGYMVLNLEAGLTIHMGEQPLDISCAVYNLLNNRYRSYTDRFRYFTDAVGRNFALRIKVPFNIK